MPLYFISTLICFWIPAILMGLVFFPKQDDLSRKAFWLTLAIYIPLSTAMEYLCLYLDIWSFSEKKDPLLGLRIFGAPIEEFSFWFGAQPFFLFSYMGFDWLFKRMDAKSTIDNRFQAGIRLVNADHRCRIEAIQSNLAPASNSKKLELVACGVQPGAIDRQDSRMSYSRFLRMNRSHPLLAMLSKRGIKWN